MGDTDRLAEIDRELDSFGKSDEVLAGVVARARELAPGGLSAIDAVLSSLGDGSVPLASVPHPAAATNGHDRAAAAAVETSAVEMAVETRTPAGQSARPARWDEPGPSRDELPEDASGLVELPEEVLRREALPAVLSLDAASPRGAEREPEAAAESEADAAIDVRISDPEIEVGSEVAPAEPRSLELELDADLAAAVAETSSPGTEAAGDGLASLFDDASLPPPVAEEPTGMGGLADLFESDRPEAEPAAHQGLADLLTPELQAELGGDLLGGDPLLADPLAADSLAGDGAGELAGDSTSIFTADDVAGVRASAEPGSLEAALEGGDEPAAASAAEEALGVDIELGPSGEFDLDIDEDVEVLDGDEIEEEVAEAAPAAKKPPTMPPPKPPTMPPPRPPVPGSQPPPDQKGFLSRILNRK